MEDRILKALKRMIEFDDTELRSESPNGTFDPEDINADWLAVLQEAQQAYFEATGEVVANSFGVVLIPGKADEETTGFTISV